MKGRGGVAFLALALCAGLVAAMIEPATVVEAAPSGRPDDHRKARTVSRWGHAQEAEPRKVAKADSATSGREAANPPVAQTPEPPSPTPEPPGFDIKAFIVEGSSLLSPEKINGVLDQHRGSGKTIADIEKARHELERAYQALGYPTVIVIIPEQTIENGVVRLTVVESRIGEVRMVGNTYYSRYNILAKLPSLRPGALIHEPTLVKELDAVNVNPDRKITPVLKPGTETGTVDVELKVNERLPLHARMIGDNKGPFTTPANRLTAEVQYTNLWDEDHILTLQTTQTPEDWGAVQAYGFSYVAPIMGPQHVLAVYASKVTSTSVLAGTTLALSPGDVSVAGNATIAGLRYFFPVFEGTTTTHQIALGADYKRLEKTEATFPGPLGTAVVLSPIQYTPLSLGYTGIRPDAWGITQFSVTAKGYWPIIPGGKKADFAGDPADPFNKPGNRAGSTGRFAVLQAGLDRTQPLPLGFSLSLHADGQWASEPLVPAEQYFAGGMDTVRGYIQNESLGDHAVRGRAELLSPPLPEIPLDRFWQRRRASSLKITWKVLAFYDAVTLWVRDAPIGQKDQFRLEGIGGGVRAQLVPYNLQLQVDQGFALQDATVTRAGDTFVHFMVSLAY
ncbi:MAG: POTRA domain-containing protein [Nitrospirota bacterium]